MSKDMTKNELIDELERVGSLVDCKLTLLNSANSIPESMKEENEKATEIFIKSIRDFQNAQTKSFRTKLPKISELFFTAPIEPPEFKNEKSSAKDILMAACTGLIMLATIIIFGLYIAGVSLEGVIGPRLTFLLTAVDLVLLIVSTFLWCNKAGPLIVDIKKWKNECEEWKIKRSEWLTKYDTKSAKEENERFLNELINYDSAFRKYAEACDEKYEAELALNSKKLSDICEKYQKELDKYAAKIEEIEKLLAEVTVIHSDMFDYAEDIASMLKMGRADSLKEAINLVFEEERKNNEEAARRREAEKQRAVLEQQAEDNRLHNEAMLHIEEQKEKAMLEHNAAIREHNAAIREHNAAMERAANAQAEAMKSQAKTQAEMAKRQEESGVSRCHSCAHRGHCSIRGSSSINCTGFQPR